MITGFWRFWIRFRQFGRKPHGFDSRQCRDNRISYDGERVQKNGAEAPETDSRISQADIVVEHERANEAQIGESLREHYGGLVEENLPRNILETLTDLNQRLKRRDGD